MKKEQIRYELCYLVRDAMYFRITGSHDLLTRAENIFSPRVGIFPVRNAVRNRLWNIVE